MNVHVTRKQSQFALIMLVILSAFWLGFRGQQAAFGNDLVSFIKQQPAQSGRSPDEEPIANCRYGLTPLGFEQIDALNTFHAGWYSLFEAETVADTPPHVEFVPLLNIKQVRDGQGNYRPEYWTELSLAQLEIAIERYPGSLWLLGNEIDRGPNPGQIQGGQGNMYPEVYAKAYHDLYQFIKQHDPTAQVAISALVEVTPGRLQYLDQIWQSYYNQFGTNMPVDVWNMHLYILPEATPDGEPNAIANVALGTDPSLAIRESGGNPALCPDDAVYCLAEHDDMLQFHQQIVAMRTWMKAHGQQNKPLILSEYSILYPHVENANGCFVQDEFGQCFTPERVTNFMLNSFDYLENGTMDPELGFPADNYRMVQQWLWFAIHSSGIGRVSNLLEADLTTLTQPGQAYVNWLEAQPPSMNLFSEGNNGNVVVNGDEATITVHITNNGNQKTEPFTVTFYADDAMTEEIGSTVVEPVAGCAREQYQATVTWTDAPEGFQEFYAQLDSENTVAETDEQDNAAEGFIFVNPRQTFLPVVRR
jgi:hypothetical protein